MRSSHHIDECARIRYISELAIAMVGGLGVSVIGLIVTIARRDRVIASAMQVVWLGWGSLVVSKYPVE